jgi:hypothetical protein
MTDNFYFIFSSYTVLDDTDQVMSLKTIEMTSILATFESDDSVPSRRARNPRNPVLRVCVIT